MNLHVSVAMSLQSITQHVLNQQNQKPGNMFQLQRAIIRPTIERIKTWQYVSETWQRVSETWQHVSETWQISATTSHHQANNRTNKNLAMCFRNLTTCFRKLTTCFRYNEPSSGQQQNKVLVYSMIVYSMAVFLNRQAAARYRALASIIPGREKFSWNLSF